MNNGVGKSDLIILNLPFRGDTNKTLVAAQKIAVAREFKAAFGHDLWKPKPGGGTTNDGRCSRLAFADPEQFSKITGVPVDLIRDFNALVVALCSGAKIDPAKFEGLANSWLDRFHSNPNISWNVLCPTVMNNIFRV